LAVASCSFSRGERIGRRDAEGAKRRVEAARPERWTQEPLAALHGPERAQNRSSSAPSAALRPISGRVDRLDRREEPLHPQLERALFLKEAGHANEAKRRGLPEVDLALDERFERGKALGLVEAARLDVFQDDADVEERLVE